MALLSSLFVQFRDFYAKNSIEMKVSVVLPAAGTGQRMSCSLPKQYIEVNGSPLLLHTFSAFLSFDFIDHIIVAVSADYHQYVKEQIVHKLDSSVRNKIIVVEGDESRHKSIFAGLRYFDNKEKPDLVVVHDSVRPFVPQDLLLELIEAASNFGASGPVCNLTSTVLRTTNGFLDCALERSKCRNSEMPQVFKYSVLKEAYDKCSENDLMYGTECLDLVKKYTNNSVKVIEAEASLLFKVTHKKDLYSVEGLLKESESLHLLSVHCEGNVYQNFKCELYSSLQSKFMKVGTEDVADCSFHFDETFQILVILLFCSTFQEICETLNNLTQCDNTKIVCVLVADHSFSIAEISSKWKEFTAHIRHIVFVQCASNSLPEKQEKAIELINFACRNYCDAINKQSFFV